MSWIGTTSPPRARLASIALALLLLSPCIGTGWVADDFFHQLMLRPDPGVAGMAHRTLDLFRFASGDPAVARQLMDAGVFPWWTDPRALLAFFRPLASATHWLDYRLWPTSPALMHIHSLVWFALLLGVVAAVYHRFSREHAPGLALLLFAIDDAHAPVVSWIANRNQIIALTLALPALLLHDDLRARRSLRAFWLGPLLFGLGLLASEAALIAGAYLLAYALVLDRGSVKERFGPLLPYGVVVLLWRFAYVELGYGAAHSGLYADPAREPFTFLAAVVERLPVLALSELALPWADFWELYPLTLPWLRYAVGAFAVVVLAVFVALVRPLWRDSRVFRFWSLGALLALVPVCASFPHDRLLLGAGIGVMAIIAELLLRAFRARKAWSGRATLAVLGGMHLGLAPILLPIRAAFVSDFNRVLGAADRTIPSDPRVSTKSIVLVNPPLDPVAAYLPVYRQALGEPRPRSLLWLSTGVTELTITGVDEHSLRVRAGSGFLSSSTQQMLRDAKRPPRVGETIELSAASILISRATSDGQPIEIVVRFREPLNSKDLLFFEWRGHGYVPFVPPNAGRTVVIPKLNLTAALFG